MKRSILAALLAFCAACAAGKPTRVEQSKHWTPTERANVLIACVGRFGTGRFCDCLTEKLETISPDPDIELTPDDMQTGVAACKSIIEATGASEAL